MKNRWIWCIVALACAGGFFVGSVVAQEGDTQPPFPKPEWMNLTKEHEQLKKGVGEWTYASKFWMAPGAPPMESTGTATTKSVLKGRYIKQKVKGEMMGESFEGVLYIGYDTLRKEHWSLWMDSSSPIPWIGRGPEKDGVVTLEGKEPDMRTGELKPSWVTVEWTGDDTYTTSMHKLGPDGKKMKTGEMIYTRKTE